MRTLAERQILAAADRIKKDERKEKRMSRPKPVRPEAAGQRQPRVRDNVYLAFIRRQPCCVCNKAAPSQAAHVRSGYPEAGWASTGMQQKPDDKPRTLPLCASCHVDGPDAQHRSNEREWWAARNIYPPALAARFVAKFEGADHG